MGFPENVLTKDEKVVAHLHPHWVTLVPATLWLIVICAASGIGIAFLPDGSAHNILLIIILVVAFALLCWLTFAPWITWRSAHYVLTSDRVLIRRGVIRHSGRDIGLSRISDVGFVLTLWDRIVGAGTLTIESAGEQGQERLTNVPHAARVQQTLNHLIDEDTDRRSRNFHGPGPGGGGPY
jgi:uncharacterized membrane protein YdbT with pleckstrin-like domain